MIAEERGELMEIRERPHELLAQLAQRANEEHRLHEVHRKKALEHALRAGEFLIEAKQRVAHGKWQQWVERNFEGSWRTAQVYMKLARNRGKLEAEKAACGTDLSVREARRVVAMPKLKAERPTRPSVYA